MEPEDLLPHSQQPATYLYPGPDKSNKSPLPIFDPFNIIPHFLGWPSVSVTNNLQRSARGPPMHRIFLLRHS